MIQAIYRICRHRRLLVVVQIDQILRKPRQCNTPILARQTHQIAASLGSHKRQLQYERGQSASIDPVTNAGYSPNWKILSISSSPCVSSPRIVRSSSIDDDLTHFINSSTTDRVNPAQQFLLSTINQSNQLIYVTYFLQFLRQIIQTHFLQFIHQHASSSPFFRRNIQGFHHVVDNLDINSNYLCCLIQNNDP